MTTLAWVVFICWAAAAIGALVLWIGVRISRLVATRSAHRLAMAETDLAAAKERLWSTVAFFETYNLTKAPKPALVKLCCKKAEPCARHVLQ